MKVIVIGRDPFFAVPMAALIAEIIMSAAGVEGTVERAVESIEQNTAQVEIAPQAQELIEVWINKNIPANERTTPLSHIASNKPSQLVAPGYINEGKLNQFDLVIDAGYFRKEKPGIVNALGDNEGWKWLASGTISFPQRLLLISESVEIIGFAIEFAKERAFKAARLEKKEHKQADKDIDGAPSLGALIEEMDLGLDNDLNHLSEVMEEGLHTLFDHVKDTPFNRFLMRCFSVGVMACLPDCSQAWEDLQQQKKG